MPAETPVTARTYTAGQFMLMLDESEVAGFFRSVEGASLKTELMTYDFSDGRMRTQLRSLGRLKYEDIKIQVGMAMSETFCQWIEGFVIGRCERHNGSIITLDFQHRHRGEREIHQVLISEIAFPTLDANDSNAAYMTVTLVPERVLFKPATSKQVQASTGNMAQKLWTPANFSFTLDGFDHALRRCTKVEGFSIKQEIHEHHVGHMREPLRVPGQIKFPDLTFYIPEVDAQPLVDHYVGTVQQGNAQPAARLSGSIVMHDHQGGDLCTISLQGVDIASIAPDKADATSDDIKQVKVGIACERMTVQYAQIGADMLE